MNPVIHAIGILDTKSPKHIAWRQKQALMWAESLRRWGKYEGDVVSHVNMFDHPGWDPLRKLITVRDIDSWYDRRFIQENTPGRYNPGFVGNIHAMKVISMKRFLEEEPQYDVAFMADVDVAVIRDVYPMLQAVTDERPIYISSGQYSLPMGKCRSARGYLTDAEIHISNRKKIRNLCAAFVLGTPAKVIEVTGSAIDTMCTRQYRSGIAMPMLFEQCAVNRWGFENHGKFRRMDQWIVNGIDAGRFWVPNGICMVHFFALPSRKLMETFLQKWAEKHG